MKKTTYMLLAVLWMLSACATTPSDPLSGKVRFDGLYQSGDLLASDGKTRYKNFLRFYPDNTVVAVASIGTPQQLQRWLAPGHPQVAFGDVTLRGNRISFIAYGGNWRVSVSGEVLENKIVRDDVDKSSAESVYTFAPWVEK